MSGVYIEVTKPESLPKVLKTFRRKVDAAGVLREYRDHESFTPRPEKRRAKRRSAKLRRWKARTRGN